MESILPATTLLVPSVAFARLSSVARIPAASLNQPNGTLTGSTFDGMKMATLAHSGSTLVIPGDSATGSTVQDYQAFPANFTVPKEVGNSWN